MKRFQKLTVFCVMSLFTVFSLSCSADSSSELSPEIYAVAYQTEHGTAPSPITVKENTVLASSQLPELSENGYRFLGWYDGDLQALAYEYKVTKNVTLTAKWKKSETSNDNKNKNNNQNPSGENENAKSNGSSDTENENAKSNGSSDTENENAKSNGSSDTENVDARTFTVYCVDEYWNDLNQFTVPENTVLTIEQLPYLDKGYEVVEGWYDDDGIKAVPGEYKVTKSVRLTAKWRQRLRVSYDVQCGALVECPECIYVDESTVLKSEQLPEVTCDGYIFGGWYDGEEKVLAGEYTVTKNVRLEAKWFANSSVTVEIPENPDIYLTAQKNASGSIWILTAESGFTNYSWRVDGKVQSETSNILILNVSDWTRGYYEVSVEAQKDGEYYSARANITVGGN